MVAVGDVKKFSVASGSQSTGDTTSSGVILPVSEGYLTAVSVQMDGTSQAPVRVCIMFGSNTGIATGAFTPDRMVQLASGWVRGDPVFGNMDIVLWTGRVPLFFPTSRLMCFVDNQTGATQILDMWYVVDRP